MKKIWKIFWGVIFLAVCSGCGIKKEQKKTIEDTKEKIYRECEMLAEDYQSIYENAAKENALYELSTIQKSMDYFGKYGYAVIDSYNQLDMVQSIKVDDFLKKAEKEKNGKTTIFQVIAGDHFIRYDLKTKQGKIDVEVSSFKWKEDTWQETYYHEFRANSWKYTENGHFFIEEYHPAGYDGPSGYRDFRVAPLNKKCRELNRKYILPFGYTLNKLFTSNWSEKNYDGIRLNITKLIDIENQKEQTFKTTEDMRSTGLIMSLCISIPLMFFPVITLINETLSNVEWLGLVLELISIIFFEIVELYGNNLHEKKRRLVK